MRFLKTSLTLTLTVCISYISFIQPMRALRLYLLIYDHIALPNHRIPYLSILYERYQDIFMHGHALLDADECRR